jgi:hypothetical protein
LRNKEKKDQVFTQKRIPRLLKNQETIRSYIGDRASN